MSLAVALIFYTLLSLCIARPYPTPLDFRQITAPSYVLLQTAAVVLIITLIGPLPVIELGAIAWGYLAGIAFVLAPHAVGIARRECLHQFEIRNLYLTKDIAPREVLICLAGFPAIAICEELFFRGTLDLPEAAVALIQFGVYFWMTRSSVVGLALTCALLAVLHTVTGSLGVVIGAHAAIQTMTGRLRSPGLFSAVYPLLEQARWKNVSPAWQKAGAELSMGAVLVWVAL